MGFIQAQPPSPFRALLPLLFAIWHVPAVTPCTAFPAGHACGQQEQLPRWDEFVVLFVCLWLNFTAWEGVSGGA